MRMKQMTHQARTETTKKKMVTRNMEEINDSEEGTQTQHIMGRKKWSAFRVSLSKHRRDN